MQERHRVYIFIILVDPNKIVVKGKNIKVIQGLFTDELAKKIVKEHKNKNILFISDIRTLPTDDEVDANNMMQMGWVEIMKPRMSMLKFRFPFMKYSHYNYYSGEIMLQPWAPKGSAETRLITDSEEIIKYDVQEYNDKLFKHNLENRTKTYKHKNYEGTWDFIYEVKLLEEFNKKFKKRAKSIEKHQEGIDEILGEPKAKRVKETYTKL
jgi:hypothetical protein